MYLLRMRLLKDIQANIRVLIIDFCQNYLPHCIVNTNVIILVVHACALMNTYCLFNGKTHV